MQCDVLSESFVSVGEILYRKVREELPPTKQRENAGVFEFAHDPWTNAPLCLPLCYTF